MRGRPIRYSSAELAFLRDNATRTRRALHADFVARFDRADVSFNALKAKCKRMGLRTGRTGYFPKGHVSHNKGRRGIDYPGMRKTQFKPGQRPPNHRPLGSERITKDGYVEIKVAQPNPHTTAKTRFVAKHRWIWANVNGPIPPRHVLRNLDGDLTNCDPDNWACVSFGVNARLTVAGFNDCDPALRPAMVAKARLDDRIGEIEPSPSQNYKARHPDRKPSKRTPPAEHLRALIVERVFYFDITALPALALDRAIAQVVVDKGWACDIGHLLNDGDTPRVIHIERSRMKGRFDLRNRVKAVLADPA